MPPSDLEVREQVARARRIAAIVLGCCVAAAAAPFVLGEHDSLSTSSGPQAGFFIGGTGVALGLVVVLAWYFEVGLWPRGWRAVAGGVLTGITLRGPRRLVLSSLQGVDAVRVSNLPARWAWLFVGADGQRIILYPSRIPPFGAVAGLADLVRGMPPAVVAPGARKAAGLGRQGPSPTAVRFPRAQGFVAQLLFVGVLAGYQYLAGFIS
jgi:hypothetical protein